MVVAGHARGPALTGARRFPPPWSVEELDACFVEFWPQLWRLSLTTLLQHPPHSFFARSKAVSDDVAPVLPLVHATSYFVELLEKRTAYSFVEYVPFNQRLGGGNSVSCIQPIDHNARKSNVGVYEHLN